MPPSNNIFIAKTASACSKSTASHLFSVRRWNRFIHHLLSSFMSVDIQAISRHRLKTHTYSSIFANNTYKWLLKPPRLPCPLPRMILLHTVTFLFSASSLFTCNLFKSFLFISIHPCRYSRNIKASDHDKNINTIVLCQYVTLILFNYKIW